MRAQITKIEQSGTDITVVMKIPHPIHDRDGEEAEHMYEALHLGKCNLTQ